MQQGAGFYGKMPCRGDFVSRNLPRNLIEGFDLWFQQGMHSARQALAEQWHARYAIAPIWRFFIAPGVFDQHGWAGVFIPSVDKVGRQFPCLICVPIAQRLVTYEQILAQESVYLRCEDLLLDCLEIDFNFDAFCQQVEALAMRPVLPATELLAASEQLAVMCNIHPMRYQYQHLDLTTAIDFPVLWMSEGTEGVAPQLLLSSGLPEAASFTRFIVGEGVTKESADVSDA